MEWFVSNMKRYWDIEGRASRTEYWMFFLFCIIFAIVLGFASGFIGLLLGDWFPSLTNLLFTIGTLAPSIAVGVRRMHDTGRSGWWLIVPIVGFVFLLLPSTPTSNEYGDIPNGTI